MEPGTGMLFVQTDGRSSYFCSSKCDKNSKLGRKSRMLPWTARGRHVKASKMPQNPKPDTKAVEIDLELDEE
jgi:large subunit ribosomal protein L24e